MISSSSNSQALLPNPDILILERIEREANRFRLTVRVEQEPTCPSIRRRSGRTRRGSRPAR
jgi:hypothetical protein